MIPVLALASGAAQALSIDGDTQLHAAVGQALSVSVPVSLAGDEVSRLYYRLTPAAGLAEAEEKAAASVHASYDPAAQAILLSSSTRLTVPAMRLHLEVGAGAVVVSRDLTVLFDIPDLSQSAPLDAPASAVPRPAAAPEASRTAAAAAEGARGVVIGRGDEQKAGRAFGDAAARSAATPAAPGPGTQLMLAPRPRYFNTYTVKQGDTLESIGEHFARAGAGSVDAVMLSIYEANYDGFPAGDPHHPLPGRQFGIPDAASIGSEPAYRVAEFKDYLRKPLGEWQVPVNLQRKPVEQAPQVAAPAPAWRHPHNLIGVAVLALLLWGLYRLFAGGRSRRAMLAARRTAAGSAPAAPEQLWRHTQAPPAPREPALELVAPPPDTEQAEITRLRELLQQQPARADIRLRLAQRLFEARRAPGFAEVALPLEQVLSPEAWERVRIMGHELLPYDHRFQPQTALTPAPELVQLMEKKGAAQQAKAPAAEPAAIDFDFHGEMARVDKARSDVFGGGGNDRAA